VKAALIPPKGYFNTARRSDIHLVLAQIEDFTYRNMYQHLDGDNFIILDNGAAEGDAVPDGHLMTMAATLGPNEIVLPDVMEDAERTVLRTKAFLWTFRPFIQDNVDAFGFMAVPQGYNVGEMKDCIKEFIQFEEIKTLGIPRHLVAKDHMGRYVLCDWLEKEKLHTRFAVHLLGTSGDYPTEIRYIATDFPWVRSVDSSMPYNYTIAGQRLEDKHKVTRPEGYFEKDWKLNDVLLQHNIDVYMRWARGVESTRS